MPKLKDFAAAKSKFKTDEEAVNYFTWVELCEKHLTGEQKEAFLNADTIDGMLDVLDEKQLKHLRSLLRAYPYQRYLRAHNDTAFYEEAFSEWFRKNVFEKEFEVDYFNALPDRIYKKQIEKTNVQKLVSEFRSRLTKFDGDLGEYCQWLILLDVDNSIPSIQRVYDVHRLLKQLDLTRLTDLKKCISDRDTASIVSDMKRLEPYFYWLATEDMHEKKYGEGVNLITMVYNSVESKFISENESPIRKRFEKERKELTKKIDNLIEEKMAIAASTIAKLGSSKTFEDSLMNVADLIGGDDEVYVKEAIGEYSKVAASGSTFNNFLRKAKLLEGLSEREFSSDAMKTFKKRLAHASEYFMKHLTDKEYTVYRGMRIDGLKALLNTSTPRITYKTEAKYDELIIDEDLINDINTRKPIVFDEGMLSTSLNKGVSAHRYFFNGKGVGNVFLTIHIPPHSKALVLDYEGIRNVADEEELLLVPRAKMKLNKIEEVNGHYEVDATVVN